MVAHNEPEPGAQRQAGGVLAGRFRLLSPLGRGGFGEVWRADELLPDGSQVRQVALKLLAPELAGADWAREARVLASLRHQALVTIFSAGLLPLSPPQPFVAMELLDGVSLARLLQERGPLRWRRALAHVREVAEALDAIHAQDIIHLDVKPANLLLGPDGRVRLIDFGVARTRGGAAAAAPPVASDLDTAALLDVPTTAPTSGGRRPLDEAPVVGTPGFLAPEVLERRTATHAADAYALGASLFQLLTGRLPQRVSPAPDDPPAAAGWRASVWAATLAGDLLDLRELVPTAPPAVVALVGSLLSLDPARRPLPGALFAACDGAFRRPFGAPEPPYRGLQAYGPEAEGLLFGRDNDSERLAAELATQPALVMQGASGSGKSSLAVAGVVPALARSFTDGRDDWAAVLVRPGHDLDHALRRARELHGERVGLVLVVDQLEELVTQLSVEQKARFVLALARYAGGSGGQPIPGLRVLCTLREDFTTRVASLGSLGALLERSVRFVAPPSVDSGRAIVVEPARLAGVRIDDERAVVDEVLRELRADEVRLPLVSFALAEWWETRRDGVLSADAWRRIGGVTGALSRHADATLDALDQGARLAARDLCLRLVNFEHNLARDRVSEPELRALGPAHATALDAFVASRLVVVDDARASFSHEALLREWGTLASWISDERAQRSEAASLAPTARRWREAPAPARPNRLLRGVDLARARDLLRARPDLLAPLADFIDASRLQATRDAQRRGGVALLAFVTLLAGLAAYALRVQQHARELHVREDDAARLDQSLKQERLKLTELQASLDRRSSELEAQRREARLCRDDLVRVEQEHRASLATRYPADSYEQRVITFLLQFEHVWNLHDVDRLASFFAPEAEWQGFTGSREQIAQEIAGLWRRNPHARWLLAEASVTRSDDQTRVRLTREERTRGALNVSVLQLTLRGDRPDRFAIEKGLIEKVIVASKPIGCP